MSWAGPFLPGSSNLTPPFLRSLCLWLLPPLRARRGGSGVRFPSNQRDNLNRQRAESHTPSLRKLDLGDAFV